MDQIANPSQWITEIYIPIQPKAVVVYKPKPEEVTPAVPDETSTENATP